MEIVIDFPPIYDELKVAFPRIGRDVIFAWNSKIYNPYNVSIPRCLIAHEAAHGRRQGNDVQGWWRRYIDEKEFRLVEETFGHFAEMGSLLGLNPNRQMKRRLLRSTAKRLASPLYRYDISQKQAYVLLKDALESC